jgi:outer membrane protein insertion porin family
VVPPQEDTAKVVEVTVREAPQRGARVGGGFNTVDFGQAEVRLTHYNLFNRGRRLDVRATVGNLLAPQLHSRGIFREVAPPMFGRASPEEFLDPSWIGSIDYTQPGFRSAMQTLGASIFTHRRIIPGVAIDEGVGSDLSLTRRIEFGSPTTASYRYELIRVRAGDLFFCINYGICDIPTVEVLQEPHTIAPLRLGFFSDRGNHPIAATEGYRLRLDLEHAAGYTGSDFQYTRISGEAIGYHPLDDLDRRVVAGRMRLGWVRPLQATGEALGIGEEHALLHPRHRFYSGGSRSVRGFWENQLGPRVLTIDPAELLGTADNGDPNGGAEAAGFCTPAEIVDRTCDPAVAPTGAFIPRPLGGTSVLEGNIEFRMRTWGNFTAVVFLDGATLGEGIRELWTGGTAALTPGVGGRLATPVGPVRVDLGVRPRLVQELPVVTEFVTEEGERELVRLQTLRTYDPLAAEDVGIIGRILGRLTLHLSIGEAF